MFEEGAAFGFVPSPVIGLQAGNLYNVVISLLVSLCCAFAAYSIYTKGKKGLSEKTISLFLAFISLYWFGAVISNFFAWLNLIKYIELFAYVVKLKLILPPLVLSYFLASEIFHYKPAVRRVVFLFVVTSVLFLVASYRHDATAYTVTYWGVQWQVGDLASLIYFAGMLLPLAMMAVYSIIDCGLRAVTEKRANLTLYLGAIIFIMLEYLQISVSVITWQRLLVRLLYILIAFGAYLIFIVRIQERWFIPREEELAPRKMMRVPFFTKLLSLFVVLAVVPITIASFLMFVSFKEIIDLYVHKPLLWNLKTSREAFIMALSHVQIQSIFLMLLTGLLVFISSVLVSRAIASSLRAISKGMEKVSDGDFSFKIRPASNDEIGDVAEYFNDMSAEIKRSREIMEKWNRELEIKVAERTEDLRTLYNISKAIGSSLDLELLINRALSGILPIIKAESYAVLIPEETGAFSVRLCRNCDKELFKDATIEAASWPQGWKGTPLRAKGKVVGILMLGLKGELEERGKNLLETISDQLAISIENVGIYEKEKEAVARLTELDRLKNEFISMVSHELRTPVTSVDGYVSLFLAGATGPVTEDQKKYLNIISENDQRLLTLINRLLDFSKIESGRFSIKRELVSINKVIAEMEETIKPQLEKKKADLKLNLKAKNHNFMGDREKMIEVFINLIENALKFGREGEPLTISVSTKDEGDFIRVEIADNGIGVAQEHLEKIFNKFYQIEDTMTRKVGGVGLGLAIVKEIIGNHHGKIWAESAGKNKGARFIFTIPVAEKV